MNNFDDFGEECHCEHCEISREYTEYALSAKTKEQMFDIIRDLFDEAYDTGYQQALYDDIQHKVQLMNKVENGF